MERIACVDDDQAVGEALVGFLRAHGLSSDSYQSAEAFLESPAKEHTWCVIADVQLPGLSGLQLQERLASQAANIPVIFVTAFADEVVRRRAIEGGAVCFLSKPVTKERLLACIDVAKERRAS